MTELERFLAKVDQDPVGCWNWIGAINSDGYGNFMAGSRSDGTRRTVRAHRYSYEIWNGPIPDGQQMHHLCRNRRCVRPDHLEAVEGKENIRRITYRQPNLKRKAQFEAITHCPHGHAYTPENTYVNKRNCRQCRACRRIYKETKRVRKFPRVEM